MELPTVNKSALTRVSNNLKIGFEFTFCKEGAGQDYCPDRRGVVQRLERILRRYSRMKRVIYDLEYFVKYDPNVIECSFPPSKNLGDQIKLFNCLSKYMAKWGWHCYQPEATEGGMHTNVDMPEKYKFTAQYWLRQIPAIAWVFAPAEDNVNSMIEGHHKSAAFNYRDYKYMEYRCVTALNEPENVELVAKFFRRFTAWVKMQPAKARNDSHYTLFSVKYNPFYSEWSKFNKLLRVLHLDPKDYVWFVQSHMRHRYFFYEHHFPKTYLT